MLNAGRDARLCHHTRRVNMNFLAEIPTTIITFNVHNQNGKHRKTRYFYYLNICDHLVFIKSYNHNLAHFTVM